MSFVDVTVPASKPLPILPVVVDEKSAIGKDIDAESEDLRSQMK